MPHNLTIKYVALKICLLQNYVYILHSLKYVNLLN